HVQEAPSRERGVVLEQALGEQEERRRAGACVERFERRALAREQPLEQLLQRRTLEGALDRRWNVAVLLEHLHEVLIAEPGRRLERAELRTLRAARGAEIGAELREVLRRQR